MKIKENKDNENLYNIEDLTFEDVVKINKALSSGGIELNRHFYNLKEQIGFLITTKVQAKKR